MYILNTPFSFYIPWKIAQTMLHSSTTKKIVTSKEGTNPLMLEHIHPEQLEQRFGGAAPNVTVFWPPIRTSPNIYLPSDDPKTFLISESDYRKRMLSGAYPKNTPSPFISLLKNEEELAGDDIDEGHADGKRKLPKKADASPMTLEKVELNNQQFYDFPDIES
eukprot:TRINITY_DN6406_c0_g1_i3.p1 TRINITY_DN6406_c0_g1~~TRINITY_DN6406_c0_g1_i3.p1  ORF type:complete len:163 (-),score=37.45 TRINITY_DN6406_c0_g1_i3:80-568(-)